jgi:hypothetical protein
MKRETKSPGKKKFRNLNCVGGRKDYLSEHEKIRENKSTRDIVAYLTILDQL